MFELYKFHANKVLLEHYFTHGNNLLIIKIYDKLEY